MTNAQQSRAILFILATVVFFTLMDATAKALTAKIGVIPTLWVRYAGQMCVVALLLAPRISSVVRTQFLGLQILRSGLLMVTSGMFFMGLQRLELTEATALMMIHPVLVTLGGAFFLGEYLGPRRLTGVAVALVGAIIIIRPGAGVFTPAAIFPLAAAATFSAYALLTRRIGANEDPWTTLFYTGLVGTIALSIIAPFFWSPTDWSAYILMLALAGLGTAGQLCLIRAFRLGEAAMLAPYTYVGLIFATLWGVVFFQEFPDRWTIFGALVISVAGLYVWYRETLRR